MALGAPVTLNYDWLSKGTDVFPAMLKAIDEARESVRLETYIFAPGALAERFRTSLTQAARRGVSVRILLDSFGSLALPASYLKPVEDEGGKVRFFNPIRFLRFGIRNHRKSLVCDDRLGFVGGFNIAQEYDGDGVTRGWCDIGVRFEGHLAHELGAVFDEMFAAAELGPKPFVRLRRSLAKRTITTAGEQLLLSGPGRGPNPIKNSLRNDLAQARDVKIVVAYFLPTWRLRRDLAKVLARGGKVQLLLAGKSDVLISKLAAQSLYRRLLRSGVKIFEYQPQVLHAKLIIIDDIVYVGSANLDQRSLHINYELMVRFQDSSMASQARGVFSRILENSLEITSDSWRKGRSFWRRLKQRWSYFFLVRVDAVVARRQWRRLQG
jgi:cardiolipin synthase